MNDRVIVFTLLGSAPAESKPVVHTVAQKELNFPFRQIQIIASSRQENGPDTVFEDHVL